jgi:hypothetical protein
VRFWISAQSPPLEGDPEERFDRLSLAAGREAAGLELRVGDLVLVYQSKSGRAVRRRRAGGTEERVRTVAGRKGIAAIAEVEGRAAHDPGIGTTEYVDGTALCWSWRAPIKPLAVDGHVPLSEVNRILGFKPTYNFGGFAYRDSGLREIEARQYRALVESFRRNAESPRVECKPVCGSRPLGPEGLDEGGWARRLLANFVAADPSAALREEGLETLGVDRALRAGDSADIVLEDGAGTVVAVQLDAEEDRLATIAHASLRRAMLELEMGCELGRSRVFLVGYSVSEETRQVCASYGVECFSVDRDLVRTWNGGRSSRNDAARGNPDGRASRFGENPS